MRPTTTAVRLSHRGVTTPRPGWVRHSLCLPHLQTLIARAGARTGGYGSRSKGRKICLCARQSDPLRGRLYRLDRTLGAAAWIGLQQAKTLISGSAIDSASATWFTPGLAEPGLSRAPRPEAGRRARTPARLYWDSATTCRVLFSGARPCLVGCTPSRPIHTDST